MRISKSRFVAGAQCPRRDVGRCSTFVIVPDELWQQAINENLLPAVRLDRGLLPSMIARGSGALIHISSIQRGLPLYDSTLAYAAVKATLTDYGKALSMRSAQKE
jgi:NAD(P)-dependent dehydrogenase (short-subunit alcohol dehydrogenase family)